MKCGKFNWGKRVHALAFTDIIKCHFTFKRVTAGKDAVSLKATFSDASSHTRQEVSRSREEPDTAATTVVVGIKCERTLCSANAIMILDKMVWQAKRGGAMMAVRLTGSSSVLCGAPRGSDLLNLLATSGAITATKIRLCAIQPPRISPRLKVNGRWLSGGIAGVAGAR